MGQLVEEENDVTMEDLVDEYFKTQTDAKNKLNVLKVKDFGEAVKSFIDKDDKDALKTTLKNDLEVAYLSLMDKDDALEILDRMGKDNGVMEEEGEPGDQVSNTARRNERDELLSSGEDDEEVAKPTRGR